MKGSMFSSRPTSPIHSSHHHQSYVSPSSTPPRAHHTFSESMMDENLDSAESIIRKWDLDANRNENFTPLFEVDNREAQKFLEAVNSLQKAMHFYVRLSSSSQNLIRAQKLMQIAIKRLEKEFYVILSSNRKNLDSESVSGRGSSTRSSISMDYYEDDVVSEDDTTTATSTPTRTPPRGGSSPSSDSLDIVMMHLKNIADCMISSGYAKECVSIYKIIRKSIIDETLYYLGVERTLTHSQIQKLDWKILEPKLKTWLHAVKVAVKTLFHGERILCDVVFSSNEKIAESCFTEISKDAALHLFIFPQNFAKSKKILSPEKIFRTLDLYEAISGLWPEIEFVFSNESLSDVRTEAVSAMVKLSEAVRLMLTQFEAAIQRDSSKSTPGGGVHPLTRYVMNFLVFLGDYSGAVADILADWQMTAAAQTPLPESYFSSTSPYPGGGEDPAAVTISARLAWLILVLLCKLDGKAVLYDDVSLSYLFLANNLNYVVSKVRVSNLGILIGSEWIFKHGSKVKQYMANYERMGWDRVVSALPEDPTVEISPQQVTQCFRRFYLGFEETYRKQSSWVIPDPKLRDEVKVSLAKRIVSGYRVFYERQRGNCARVVGSEPIVRYAPEDLDNYLSDLFFASTAVAGSGSSKASSYHG